ncbi:MAG: P22 phage major capsid protein family protein [Steroidobacteraceae bacterium]
MKDDDSFAKSGAKIGDSLKIRLPNQFTVRSGAALSAQNTTETSTTLTVSQQKGVDVEFTSAELTLSMDDFAQRILEPAMAVLAANIEADAFSMVNDVYNVVNNTGSPSPMTLKALLQGRKVLTDNLAPSSGRKLILNTQDNLDLVDSLKTLFQDSTEIAKQYREGMVGRTAGFGEIYENTLIPTHTTGTAAATSGYLVNGGSQTGSTLTVDTGTTTFLVGDVITIAGVYRVHPETKVSTSELQQFVVTANSGTSATSLAISPAIVTSGGSQNVSGSPADNAAISKIGGNGTVYKPSLAFHENAFTFATADLVMPQGVDFSAREVYDGISMRIVRQYAISTDTMPCRIDVLYGYKTIRPQIACQILSN